LLARFPLQRHLTRRALRLWFAALTLALAPGFARSAGADVQFVDVAASVGLDFTSMARSLSEFAGVHRRFERLGNWRKAAVIDDYAHHPTEVSATLSAAREVFPDGRLHVVFQPHLYSRTRHFAGDFGRALLAADTAIVTDVYGSREAPLDGVSGELVVRAARESGHRRVHYVPDWRDVPPVLESAVEPGDAVLTMGAGDIYRLARLLVEEDR